MSRRLSLLTLLLAFISFQYKHELLTGVTWTIFSINAIGRGRFPSYWPQAMEKLEDDLLDAYLLSFYKSENMNVTNVAIPPQKLPEITAEEYRKHPSIVPIMTKNFRHPLIIRNLFPEVRDSNQFTKECIVSELGHLKPYHWEESNPVEELGDKYRHRPSKPRPTYRDIVKNFSSGGNNYVAAGYIPQNDKTKMEERLKFNEEGRVGPNSGFFSAFGEKARNAINLWFMFSGNDEGFTYWHSAGSPSLGIHVTGKKKWYFIEPKYSLLLRPRLDRVGPVAQARPRGGVDPRPDSEKEFSFVPRYEAEIGPGDVLFNPSWWWHDVTNMKGENEFVFLLSIRPLFSVTHDFANNWIFTSILEFSGAHDAYMFKGWWYPPFVFSGLRYFGEKATEWNLVKASDLVGMFGF